MATTNNRAGYDTNIGSDDRSVIAVTKFWGIVMAVVALTGVILIASYFLYSGTSGDTRRINSENTATRPAEP